MSKSLSCRLASIDTGWMDLFGTAVTDSIVPTISDLDQSIRKAACGFFSLSMSLKRVRGIEIALGQMAGVLKSPRCTYRTIKRDCAKRNRTK